MQVSTDSTMLAGIQAEQNKWNSTIPNGSRSVIVLFTSANRTLKALESARRLSKTLCRPILVLATPVIPFPLPLEEPQVPIDFKLKRFAEAAEKFPENISVVACPCRDRLEALKQALPLDSPVLIGIRKRWWPNGDKRLASDLGRSGFSVTAVDTE